MARGPSHCSLQRPHRVDKITKMPFVLQNHSFLTIRCSFFQFLSSVERSIIKPERQNTRCCDDRDGVSMASKMREIDSECLIFNPEWKSKYFVTHVGSKAICLIIVFHDTMSFINFTFIHPFMYMRMCLFINSK